MQRGRVAGYAAVELDVTIGTWERAHAALLDAGESALAAGTAVRVVMHLLFDTALTASWPNRTEPGGTRGLHDYFTRDFATADGKDVRLGGGVSTVRAFLDADLVDTMHVAVAPVEFGRGGKLWDSPDDLLDRFHLERIPSPSGVTHHLL